MSERQTTGERASGGTTFAFPTEFDVITLTRGPRGVSVGVNGSEEVVLSYTEIADRLTEPAGCWGVVVEGVLHETHESRRHAFDRFTEYGGTAAGVSLIRVPYAVVRHAARRAVDQ